MRGIWGRTRKEEAERETRKGCARAEEESKTKNGSRKQRWKKRSMQGTHARRQSHRRADHSRTQDRRRALYEEGLAEKKARGAARFGLLGLLVALELGEDSQYVHEKVDDVQIEVDGGENVFVHGVTLHEHRGVEDNIEGEDTSAANGNGEVQPRRPHEHLNDAGDDQNHQGREKTGPKKREVTFALESVYRQPNNNRCREPHCFQNRDGVEGSTNNPNGVSLTASKQE
mmetsp:Transcript_1658/g.3174  ORF Transcript_1658/g.3174 Transcript_1658/m.3174 type:complete len:229 (+) Transcript_1658:244-930(+)